MFEFESLINRCYLSKIPLKVVSLAPSWLILDSIESLSSDGTCSVLNRLRALTTVLSFHLVVAGGARTCPDDAQGPLLVDLDDGALSGPEGHLEDLSRCRSNQLGLERGDQELRPGCKLVDQVCDGGAVLGVESMVELVEDVEWCRVELEHSEDE